MGVNLRRYYDTNVRSRAPSTAFEVDPELSDK